MNYNPQSNKQLKGGITMLKELKIALLIVILAEEIRSAKKPNINVILGIDEREITKIVNNQNVKNSNSSVF